MGDVVKEDLFDDLWERAGNDPEEAEGAELLMFGVMVMMRDMLKAADDPDGCMYMRQTVTTRNASARMPEGEHMLIYVEPGADARKRAIRYLLDLLDGSES